MKRIALALVAGHGPVGGRADLARTRDMLAGFRGAIAAMKAEGRSLEEVRAAKPTAAFDERLGGGFVNPDALVGFIYASVD